MVTFLSDQGDSLVVSYDTQYYDCDNSGSHLLGLCTNLAEEEHTSNHSPNVHLVAVRFGRQVHHSTYAAPVIAQQVIG